MDKIHPAAMLFPQLEGEEYTAFVESIRQQGQLVKGVRDKNGQLLDGRNRQRACQDLGIPFQYITYDGDDEVDFIVAANIRRRHLTPSQLGMLGNDLVPLYTEEASTRAQAGRAKGAATPTGKGQVRSIASMEARDSEPTFIDGQPGILTKTVSGLKRPKRLP
jgi:hypothetical protein